jgi:hypothetical protein
MFTCAKILIKHLNTSNLTNQLVGFVIFTCAKILKLYIHLYSMVNQEVLLRPCCCRPENVLELNPNSVLRLKFIFKNCVVNIQYVFIK